MTEAQLKTIRRAAELLDFEASQLELHCKSGGRWTGSSAQRADYDEFKKVARDLRAVADQK